MSGFGDLEDNAPDGGYWEPQSHTSTWTDHPALDELAAAGETAPHSAKERADEHPPQATASSASAATEHPSKAATPEKRKKRLTVTVTSVEITKNADPIITLDVTTNLPRFRSSSYRGVRRAHSEIRRFANHLSSATPECFVPTLPAATTSFPASSPENVHQIKVGMQKWFDRITRSPLLARDEEFLYFVEYKSTYSPIVKIKPPATGLARKMIKQRAPPDDEVVELRDFRPMAKLLYQYATESHSRTLKVARSRRAMTPVASELGVKIGAMVQTESKKGMINLWTKLSKVVTTVGDIESTKATLLEGYYGDAIQATARDAYSIKETLTNRHILMRDLLKCQADSAARHETATRLRGANNISPAKVDEAITQLEDAKQLERRITSAVRRVTDNLVVEKTVALQRLETDLLGAISQYTVRTIDAERRALSVWESIRRDIRAVDARGGLSKLGRDGLVRRSGGVSQSLAGDSWSGDRLARAKDLIPAEAIDEVVDAKSAASLLSSVYE